MYPMLKLFGIHAMINGDGLVVEPNWFPHTSRRSLPIITYHAVYLDGSLDIHHAATAFLKFKYQSSPSLVHLS